jgi:hypothetical protein
VPIISTTALDNAPIEEAAATIASMSVNEGSRPITPGVEQDTSSTLIANSSRRQQTASTATERVVEHILQSSSSTTLFDQSLTPTADIPSGPITALVVLKQSPSGQSGNLPEIQSVITEAAQADDRQRQSTASARTQDSGYKSKDSSESARSEEPSKPETTNPAGTFEASKIAPENIPLPVDNEDELQFVAG